MDRMEAGFKETGEMEKERKGLAVFKKKEKGNLASDAYIHRMIHRVKLKRVRLRRVRGFLLRRFCTFAKRSRSAALPPTNSPPHRWRRPCAPPRSVRTTRRTRRARARLH